MLKLSAISATVLLACVLTPAAARAETAPSDATESLTIGISGYITPKCELVRRDAATQSFGDILDARTGRSQPRTLDLQFHLTCNAPYEATLTSKNGGLAFDGTKAPGFSTTVAYSAAIDLDAKAGDLSLDCDSSDMRGRSRSDASPVTASRCTARSRARGVSDGDGKIHLTLKRSSQPLLKGNYSDEIILRVSPRC